MTVPEIGTTLEEREGQFQLSIVRILDRGWGVIGTGFIVASDLIVTCAHVVLEALEEEGRAIGVKGGETIEILPRYDLPENEKPIETTVGLELFRDKDAEDVAFLRLDFRSQERLRRFLGEVRPLGLATSHGLEGGSLRGFAFPKVKRAGALMTAVVAGPLTEPRRGRRLQLSSTTISPGCSGGPLWDEHGHVVGMAVSIIVDDETGRNSDTAFVISAEVLAGVCGELSLARVERGRTEAQILRGEIGQRWGAAIERGELSTGASIELGTALERLLEGRVDWLEFPGRCLATVEVEDGDHDDLRLPLELLPPPKGAQPLLMRCALASTETAPEGPRSHPEGGRIVLATADAGGPVPDDDLRQALLDVCRTGLHLTSGSKDDLKRGAFDPDLDHLPRVSRAALQQALGPRDDRPGAAVLHLVCHVSEQGLSLHDDSGQEVVVGAEAFADMLRLFVSHLRVVVLVPVAEVAQGDPGRTLADVALALHRRGLAAVVAPRVPLLPASSTGLTTALFGALLGSAEVPPESLELALVRANGHLSTQDRLAHLGLRLWARAADGHDTRPLVIRPYRNLLSFEPEHARFYWGRQAETTRVVERLAELEAAGQPRLVLLVGASGVGKSSLAKAGVVPALAKQGWEAILTRPAVHSGEQLEMLVRAQEGARRLVVVDQLEEVLTETGSHHEAGQYLQQLWGLASEAGVAVVATLRTDALDRGAEVKVDAEGERTLEQLVPGPHAMFVRHLDAEALREVISKPARDVGLELDPGLVDRLCTEALAEPGALPMLELVLDELWSRREGRRMVAPEYEGGLAKQLADYADERVAELPESQQKQAQRILVRIATGPVVELATWRRRTTVETLRPAREERRADFDTALAALVDARLVVRGDLRQVRSHEEERKAGVAHAVESVELAHDMLLRQWDTLGRWIEDAAPRLVAITKLERWVADHRDHTTTLLTSEQLAFIEQAKLTTDGDDLNDLMVGLITMSRRAVQKRKQLRFALFALTVVVAVGFAFATLIAWKQSIRSERISRSERKLAAAFEEKKNEAEMRVRMEQGTRASLLAKLHGHGAEALPLALEAAGADDMSDDVPQEILQGLADAMRVTARHVTFRPKGGRLTSLVVSEDGRRFASLDGGGNISVFDSSSPHPIFETTARGARGNLAVSSRGEMLAIVTSNTSKDEDFAIQIWHVERGQVQSIEGHTKRFRDWSPQAFIKLTPDGSSVIAATDDCSIWIWSTTTGRALKHIKDRGSACPRRNLMHLTHVNEQQLSLLVLGRKMWKWREFSDKVEELPTIHESPVESISCTKTNLCATGDFGGWIHLWNPLTMDVISRIDSKGLGVDSIALSPSGNRLASITRVPASPDLHRATLWDPHTGRRLFSETGRGFDRGIFFRMGGSRLLVQNGETINIRDGTKGVLIESYTNGGRKGTIPSEHQFLTSDKGGDAVLGDLWSGEIAFLIPGSTNAIDTPSFLADGRILVALPDHIEVWDNQPLQPARSAFGIAKFIDAPLDDNRADAPSTILTAYGSTTLFLEQYTATKETRSISLGECVPRRDTATTNVVYSDDGSRIGSMCNGSVLTIWNTRDGERIFERETNVSLEPGPHIKLSRDGGLALAYSGSLEFGKHKHSYQLWNIDEHRLLLEEHDLDGGIEAAALLPAQNKLLLSKWVEPYRVGPVEVWNLRSGQLNEYLDLPQDYTSFGSFSPSGDAVLFSQSDSTYLLGPTYRSPKLLSTASPGYGGRQAFSKSGEYLAVADHSGITIWDPKQQQTTSRLIAPSSTSRLHPSNLVFSGDEQRIFAFVDEDRFAVWYKNGKLRCLVDAHGSHLSALGASFEGDRAVTGTSAGEVVLWDTNSCTKIVVLAKLGGAITDIRFTSDDDHVVIRGGKGAIQLWNVSPHEWRAMGCSVLDERGTVAGC